MASSELIGRRVQIGMVDPWDFVTENGSVRTGLIVNLSEPEGPTRPVLCVNIDEPVEAAGKVANSVWASFRHADATKSQLLDAERVFCNFSTLPDFASSDAIGFLGDLQLIP